MKQDKYTKSAKGQPCTVRIPGVCKPAPDNETTVLAHLNGYGMGIKYSSIHGAYACSQCHNYVDGGWVEWHVSDSEQLKERVKLYHLEAAIRTQQIMIKEGVLKI